MVPFAELCREYRVVATIAEWDLHRAQIFAFLGSCAMKFVPYCIRFVAITIFFLPFVSRAIQAQEAKALAPAVPLFNGKDLSGWVPVNVAPNTFTVRDGMIISTGKPTGVMRTDRMYENCIVELEWRHLVNK